MTFHRVLLAILLAGVPAAFAQTPDVAPDRISNWPAPPFWSPSQSPRAAGAVEEARPSGKATASTPLPFVAITPCRVADTRGNGFTGAYGPPSVGADTVRSFKITGVCGIPAGAAASSFNFSALNVSTAGDLRVFPAGGSVPMVSTLNYNADTPNIANAAIVTLGTDGAIAVRADAATIDLVIDVNGYYAGGVVTSANGLAGDVTVKGAGSVSVSTSGDEITVTGPSTLPPSGLAEGDLIGLYPNPSLRTGVVTGQHLASGYVVRSINTAQDNVTIVGGGGTVVSTVGNTITVSAPGAGGLPSGTTVLGKPGDPALLGAGFTEKGPSNQDVWKLTSFTGAPVPRQSHSAVWTGTRMIVWGGFTRNPPRYEGVWLASGGSYDPVSDSWTSLSASGLTGREGHTAIWTGTKMIVWGGSFGSLPFNSGGRYDPVENSWTTTSTVGAPVGREGHTAVWTGSTMIVWGGYDGTSRLNTGGRYDPSSDTWTPTSTVGAPTARGSHTAVWSGSRMIVWGGSSEAGLLNTGGRYNPSSDTWTPTSAVGAPTPRHSHTAIWWEWLSNHPAMIVWGGYDGAYTNSGAQYYPGSDSWSATATAGAPAGRSWHSAVRAARKMIVWGGGNGIDLLATGGNYDPEADLWTPTSNFATPMKRSGHTAVWTDLTMIVWGGYNGNLPMGVTNEGGQYTVLSLYVKN